MPSSRLLIRPERHTDATMISDIISDAFGGTAEADLVEALRDEGDLTISLVAWENDQPIGHIALSRLFRPARALALAPLSVRRESQHRGIGTALVHRAIDLARANGTGIVFVLGDPEYYQRFAFSTAAAHPYPSAYSGPDFMALVTGSSAPPPGDVRYPNAFAAFG